MSNFKKTYFSLIFFTIFMFSFSYMLVPLYDIFCEITGLNGKTNQTKVIAVNENPVERFVTVKFTSTVANSAPFTFEPIDREMIVQVGKINNTFYTLTNNTKTIKHATASPSVVPHEDAEYFKKIECFCFSQQQINGLETKELPLQFIIDNELPNDTRTLILSYTMFNTTDQLGSN
ncbi:MAG: cytochrome c oxidase assembly protein [Gammaproteobacteria bacterium]|nr:cytochrome c oxidase assembly protein [Gammaproteobacteria bacterium]MBT4462536.1 cytochrome c oxidase assembly protein [Gammaproteobacteria bacterium]MBT4654783.1 cytochrome c oxidase assembly protein [Gammaproteobacteria bacterium]MBT5116832.1 cytochrome c oxidase assembly protein [Gammaproteobacteria bacterium]MBT5761656.1 cytochrome c oxidase assembly protein [Gammaproteobacteria bacterium]